mmetsp:Transcript_20113/g.77011  ORF Transcript_20113/g.77011 Transcript_20113/m.77011 type:complete len:222 (+) Transcript_20113:353-1018(+)
MRLCRSPAATPSRASPASCAPRSRPTTRRRTRTTTPSSLSARTSATPPTPPVALLTPTTMAQWRPCPLLSSAASISASPSSRLPTRLTFTSALSLTTAGTTFPCARWMTTIWFSPTASAEPVTAFGTRRRIPSALVAFRSPRTSTASSALFPASRDTPSSARTARPSATPALLDTTALEAASARRSGMTGTLFTSLSRPTARKRTRTVSLTSTPTSPAAGS